MIPTTTRTTMPATAPPTATPMLELGEPPLPPLEFAGPLPEPPPVKPPVAFPAGPASERPLVPLAVLVELGTGIGDVDLDPEFVVEGVAEGVAGGIGEAVWEQEATEDPAAQHGQGPEQAGEASPVVAPNVPAGQDVGPTDALGQKEPRGQIVGDCDPVAQKYPSGQAVTINAHRQP